MRRTGEDQGPPEDRSPGALGAPGPGVACLLSGPPIPSVENGAHEACCPFAQECSLQWLSCSGEAGGQAEVRRRPGRAGPHATDRQDAMEPYSTCPVPAPCMQGPLTPDAPTLHTGGAAPGPEEMFLVVFKTGSQLSRLSNQFSDSQAAVKKKNWKKCTSSMRGKYYFVNLFWGEMSLPGH